MIQRSRAFANVRIGQGGVIGVGQKTVFGQLQVGFFELPENRIGAGVMEVRVPHQLLRV
jgi:hypothetical protein